MKKSLTRREFVGVSMVAGAALAGRGFGQSSSRSAAAAKNAGKKYDGVGLSILAPGFLKVLEVFAAEFRASTGATVRITATPEDPQGWWALDARAKADAVSARPQFDLILCDCNHAWTLWPHLLPLDDLIRKSGYDMSGFFAPVQKYGQVSPTGSRYALPIRVRVPVILYRKDVIGEMPTNWDDYDRMLAAATAGDQFGLSLPGASYPFHPFGLAEKLTHAFLARYWSTGEQELSRDGKPLVGGEKGVWALETLKRQMRHYASPDAARWDPSEAARAFIDGKAATTECVPTPALFRKLEDPKNSKVAGKWAIGAYPGSGGAYFTSQEMKIFKHTRHPEAAFEFMAHCTNLAASRRLLPEHDETPARREPWLENTLIPRAQNLNMTQALDRGIMFAAGRPQWLEMLTALWETIGYSMNGYLSSRQALTLAAEKWEHALRHETFTVAADPSA